jgi:lysyl-tRNA synthetase class 2
MPSSVIRRYAYDPAKRELVIEFTTSRLYVYFNVPEAEAARFAAASSKGRYFNLHIRDRYGFMELENS